MSIYIALFRGINVGGKNIVKMAELKRMFEGLGFGKVVTYIQSGNVLFESNEEEAMLQRKIEDEFLKVFGFSTSVIFRKSVELERIINNCPFSREAILEAESTCEGESLYVALLRQLPTQEGIERLNAYSSNYDQFQIEGREVYLLFHHSIRNSKLAINLHRLEVPATVRNWKTLNKLGELAKTFT